MLYCAAMSNAASASAFFTAGSVDPKDATVSLGGPGADVPQRCPSNEIITP